MENNIQDRNIKIFDARLHGDSLKRIAEDFNISVERARQIIIKQRHLMGNLSQIVESQRIVIKSQQDQIERLSFMMRDDSAVINDKTDCDLKGAELSVRSYNCLYNLGIKSLSDLVYIHESHLLSYPNLGRKSLREIKDVCKIYGIILGYKADSEILSFVYRNHEGNENRMKQYLKMVKERNNDFSSIE